MVAFAKSLRGNEHWSLSAQDRGGGMTFWIYRSDSAAPVYTVVVDGYRLGRHVTPVVIDSDGPGLPQGLTRSFEDTTVLPGRCILQTGPPTLDVMSARMVVNGKDCEPGGQIAVRIAPTQ